MSAVSRLFSVIFCALVCLSSPFALAKSTNSAGTALPFGVLFQGREKFDLLVARAARENWSNLEMGERVATVGKALVGTPYKSFTLDIDDRIEGVSVNFTGLDCWTFFETSLAFARMIAEPRENWTPERLLHYVELDRYRDGKCTGAYLSRLHYLEDWAIDNESRGLVKDLTRSLGGSKVAHQASEMTHGWKQYRYLRSNRALLPGIERMEARITGLPMYCIPISRVKSASEKIRSGDIICIVSKDGGRNVATSHVGLALRDSGGKVHFMHASSPRNYGKVVVDDEIDRYLRRYKTDVGIMVVRPLPARTPFQ
ncbi:MAG: DUF1460 domain-containing protein [Chthoniobacteraceae bacterium]|nr:DUF1460 domain-containing protein [Chthoniobacteraceae bacterium]